MDRLIALIANGRTYDESTSGIQGRLDQITKLVDDARDMRKEMENEILLRDPIVKLIKRD